MEAEPMGVPVLVLIHAFALSVVAAAASEDSPSGLPSSMHLRREGHRLQQGKPRHSSAGVLRLLPAS